MNCTRCGGTGFLNLEQVPEFVCVLGNDAIVLWIDNNSNHDAQVCDCCGDGNEWYGIPGEHYGYSDPPGKDGSYAYNGGLCECH